MFISLISVYVYESGSYKKYYKVVLQNAKTYNVEPELVLSIIRTESCFDGNLVSKKGAQGIMQIMPQTAKFIAKNLNYDKEIDLFNNDLSIKFGTYYLSYLKSKFDSEIEVICAYNAGEGNVNNWKTESEFSVENIKFKETKIYYKRVKRRKKLYKIILNGLY